MIEPSAECSAFIHKIIPEQDRFELFMERCRIYADFLYETNKTLNLTRIMEDGFWTRHAADSLALAAEVSLFGKKKLCDVGCGAGFPSLILAAAFQNLEITAVDSTRKKVDFVAAAAEKMGLKNLHTEHARANELARKPQFSGAFDFVTARAVSDTVPLMYESFRFLRRGGRLCVYRTLDQTEKELDSIRKTGITFRTTVPFELPDQAGTRLFLILQEGRLPKKSDIR